MFSWLLKKKSRKGSENQTGFLRHVSESFLNGLAIGILLSGCAAPSPGTDPIVLNLERVETDARSSFKSLLLIDNQNRPYFQTNAPPFHDFCSWLREPTEYANSFNAAGLPADVQMVPRDLAMLLSLDDVKVAYKAGRATSNDVFTAIMTVQTIVTKGATLVAGLTNSVGH